jgi:hypothetical protein
MRLESQFTFAVSDRPRPKCSEERSADAQLEMTLAMCVHIQ